MSQERDELLKKQQEDAFLRDLDMAHSKNDKNGDYMVKIRVSCN